MPRRLISSEIFFNDKVAELTNEGKILFIGMITNADDEGILKGSAKYLRARIFPYNDYTPEQIQQWRDKCQELKLINVYSQENTEYIYLLGWNEHQSIRKDRVKPTSFPKPNAQNTAMLPIANQQPTNTPPSDNHNDNQLSTECLHNISKGNISKGNIKGDDVTSSSDKSLIYKKTDNEGNPIKDKSKKVKIQTDTSRGEKVKEVFVQLDKLRGYVISVKRGAENKSVLRMLNSYTPDQIIETWQSMKKTDFRFKDRELYMMSVEGDIGAKNKINNSVSNLSDKYSGLMQK